MENDYRISYLKYSTICILLMIVIFSCNTIDKKKAKYSNRDTNDKEILSSLLEENDSLINKIDSVKEDTSIHIRNVEDSLQLNLGIRTNYNNLFEEYHDLLKDYLKTDDLRFINDSSVSVLRSFISSVLSNKDGYIRNDTLQVYLPITKYYHHIAFSGRHQESISVDLYNRLLGYSIYNIDRDSENISKIWVKIKPFFTSLMPADSIVISDIDKKIDDLINGYLEITAIENYESKLDSIVEICKRGSYGYYGLDDAFFYSEDYYSGIINYNEKVFYEGGSFGELDLGIFMGEFLKEKDAIWICGRHALTFWYRRYRERNMDVVYEILLEMKLQLSNLKERKATNNV